MAKRKKRGNPSPKIEIVDTTKPIVLISGIPGAGKSFFGRWLVANKSFLHFEFEQDKLPISLEKHGLTQVWERFSNDTNSHEFIDGLRNLNQPVALDYGFPVNDLCLSMVQRFCKAGITPWWFTGDRLQARIHMLVDKPNNGPNFDKQYASITEGWPKISQLFGSNIIQTVPPDGTHVSPVEIYTRIFPAQKKRRSITGRRQGAVTTPRKKK